MIEFELDLDDVEYVMDILDSCLAETGGRDTDLARIVNSLREQADEQ